ncbi:hypothetical protein QJQ45_010607 [Haematococcus lacustris]|nr:hypothetical protein QJQ45_010607 [Haematococcus lacustris]
MVDTIGPQGDIVSRKPADKKKKKRRAPVEVVDATLQEVAASSKRRAPDGTIDADDAGDPSIQPATSLAAAALAEDSHASAAAGKQSRSHISLVPQELSSYLSEVHQHFQTLVDDEERQLLVSNVLQEVAGSEALVTADPVCSRLMESLLSCAQPGQLVAVLAAVVASGGIQQVAVSPFGSHVADNLLLRLHSQQDAMGEEDVASLKQLLSQLTSELCSSLWDFINDRYATHVARRLLCVLCGRDVRPAGSKGPQAAAPGPPSGEAAEGGPGGRGHSKGRGAGQGQIAQRSGLAAKVVAEKGWGVEWEGQESAAYPELVEAIVQVLCSEEYAGDAMAELSSSRDASPFLQAALKAAATLPNCSGLSGLSGGEAVLCGRLLYVRKVLAALVPSVLGAPCFVDGAPKAGKMLEGVANERVSQLDSLAAHPSANFVLQALLAACNTPGQVQPLFEELAPSLGTLLRGRRSGVVAALVAACSRAGCCQKEMCAKLAAALPDLAPQWKGKSEVAVAAPALLTLDTYGVSLGTDTPLPELTPGGHGAHDKQVPPARLSPLGGAILINLLRFAQGACRVFTDSLVEMSTADLARVGRDPSGSRVLEALLEGTAPAKVKQKLLGNMSGGFGVMALTGSGSFLVERCYGWAELGTKAALVADLVAQERALAAKHWGSRLLAKVGAEAFKRDQEQWKRHVMSAEKELATYSQLFGQAEPRAVTRKPAGASAAAGSRSAVGSKSAAHDEAADPELTEQPGHVVQAEEGVTGKKQKKKRKLQDTQQQQGEIRQVHGQGQQQQQQPEEEQVEGEGELILPADPVAADQAVAPEHGARKAAKKTRKQAVHQAASELVAEQELPQRVVQHQEAQPDLHQQQRQQQGAKLAAKKASKKAAREAAKLIAA